MDLREAHGVVYDAGSKYLVPLCVLACALAALAMAYAYFSGQKSDLRFEAVNAARAEDRRAWDRQFEMQIQQYREAAMASTLLERRYKDVETYALMNGWKVPKDDQHGPLGNLDRMKGDTK